MRKVILVYIDEDGVGPMVEHILDERLKQHNPRVTVGSSIHGVRIPMMDSQGRVETVRMNDPVPTRDQAENIIAILRLRIQTYKFVTVAYLNSLLGKETNPNDFDQGWTDTAGFEIVQVDDGYLIKLPAEINLEELWRN